MVLSGKLHDARDLFRRRWEYHYVWPTFLHRAVIFVEKKIFRPVKNGSRADELLEFLNDAGVHKARRQRTSHYSEISVARATLSYAASATVC
jgi:hypothetical protein